MGKFILQLYFLRGKGQYIVGFLGGGEVIVGEKFLYSIGYVLNKNLMIFVSVERKV